MDRSNLANISYHDNFRLLHLTDGSVMGESDAIAACERCRANGTLTLTQQPDTDIYGFLLPEEHFVENDGPSEVVCSNCREREFNEELDEHIIDTLERKLSLDERHREGLKELIQTVFTDPDKILKLPLLESDVRKLEERLEDQRKQNSWQLTLLGIIATIFAALLTVTTLLLAN